jgi:hypothetical protein
MGDMRHIWTEQKCIQGFGRETSGKETTRRSSHRWDDNIEMNLKEAGWRGLDWIDLARNRVKWRAVLNMVMNLIHKTQGIS